MRVTDLQISQIDSLIYRGIAAADYRYVAIAVEKAVTGSTTGYAKSAEFSSLGNPSQRAEAPVATMTESPQKGCDFRNCIQTADG